jgi:hypothetical protein
MKLHKRIAMVMTVAMLAVVIPAMAAGANVERHQYVDYELEITGVNSNPAYWHDYSIHYDPDTGEYTGTGEYFGGTETGSDFEVTDESIGFRSDYDTASYTWFPYFTLNPDGTLTFIDGFGPDNVDDAEGTYTVTETEHKNHGQFVREAEDKKAAAHSLIGMPTKSKKNK